MKILLWHGYLLTGSGSNLYTANLARVWRKQGHDVLLLCQERAAAELSFIDAHGDFEPDNGAFNLVEGSADKAAGSCRLARPAIGEVLPVYVYDAYPGFTAKTFVDLDDNELAHYTDANIRALATAIEEHSPDAIITGHEVMGPYIALKACAESGTEYLAKLHGSALEYAVKKQQRYVPYAREGLGGAKVVAGGSNYMIKEAASVVSGWEHRAAVVNPGCDIELFKPTERGHATPVVGYVGKLIAAKGVHNLLAALGVTKHQNLTAVIVGYGGFDQQLKALWGHLMMGDEDAVREVASAGDGAPLASLLEWLDRGSLDARYVARVSEIDCRWPGRLDHGPLSKVLPTFDALVVPSVVPEAFGMVAAEAAACGVLPIVPRHSGIGEVGDTLERELGRPGLLTYDPADPVAGLAAAIDRVLGLEPAERKDLERAASSFAREMWSWDHVAQRLVDLAAN